MSTRAAPRPAYLRPGAWATVAVGGAAGTLARHGVDVLAPGWSTLAVNLTGAFALGLLLQLYASRGAGDPRGTHVRLLLGTGFLGGFTTYSTLALQTGRLLRDGAGPALAYGGGMVLAGLACATAGVALASVVVRRGQAR